MKHTPVPDCVAMLSSLWERTTVKTVLPLWAKEVILVGVRIFIPLLKLRKYPRQESHRRSYRIKLRWACFSLWWMEKGEGWTGFSFCCPVLPVAIGLCKVLLTHCVRISLLTPHGYKRGVRACLGKGRKRMENILKGKPRTIKYSHDALAGMHIE